MTPTLRTARAVRDEVALRFLLGVAQVVRALPSRWVLRLSDHLGDALRAVDVRGRTVGRQNLRAVFGDGLPAVERGRILRASYRNSVRSVLLLLHVAPMTPARLRRWVDVPDDMHARLRASVDAAPGGVMASGHVGCWELLLGLPGLFPGLPDVVFLAEGLGPGVLDRFLAMLRGTGGASSVLRTGGARVLSSHVRAGGAAALLVDRNVREWHGGIWSPFLGLRARTTPLPGWLAVKHGVHVRPVFCLPGDGDRYRIWLGTNVTEGVDLADEEAAIAEIAHRLNRVVETVVRERPEIWNWTLKRFKSRPDRELGPYPAYSLWDPDPPPGATAKERFRR